MILAARALLRRPLQETARQGAGIMKGRKGRPRLAAAKEFRKAYP